MAFTKGRIIAFVVTMICVVTTIVVLAVVLPSSKYNVIMSFYLAIIMNLSLQCLLYSAGSYFYSFLFLLILYLYCA